MSDIKKIMHNYKISVQLKKYKIQKKIKLSVKYLLETRDTAADPVLTYIDTKDSH